MRSARLCARRSAVLLLGCALGTSFALEPGRARADQSAQAASLAKFDEGKKAFDKGQFEQAMLAFQASIELQPSPNTRLYIARCHRAQGRVASAYTNFKLASREAQDRLTASGEKRYTATRDAAASEAAELESKVPRLTLVVPADPPAGFAVSVDGKDVPRAAWGVAVETDPGSVEIAARGARSKRFHEKLTLSEGEQKRVEVKLEHLPTAHFQLRFPSRPAGIAVTLDGTALDPSAFDHVQEVDVGPHVIVVRAPGYLPFRWTKDLADREEASVAVTLKADARAARGGGTPKWIFYGVAGASVVALGAGTYIALGAKSKSDEEQAKDPLERDAKVQGDIKSQATTANILFVAGGMLAVGAGVLAFTTDWKSPRAERAATAPPRQNFSLSPWVGPGVAGAGAGGRF